MLRTDYSMLRAFSQAQIRRCNLPRREDNSKSVRLSSSGLLDQKLDEVDGHDLSQREGRIAHLTHNLHFDSVSGASFGLAPGE